MNLFYNNDGVGDVLLITINDRLKGERRVERNGQVARIYDDKNGKTLGYNLFGASASLPLSQYNGTFSPDKSMVNGINQFIQDEGFEDSLEYDPEPSFVVSEVEKLEKHPDADKLSVCQVNVGSEVLQIVCGAPNVDAGQKVVVALVGAVLPSGMVIKDAKLRGVPSTGMICSAKELAIPNAPDKKGILVLDADVTVGTDFFDTVNH